MRQIYENSAGIKKRYVAILWAGIAFLPSAAAQDAVKVQMTPQDPAKPSQVRPADPALAKIDEFRIQLGSEAAGFSRPASGSLFEVVNPFKVRKRGRYYGSAYEFHRNDNFDARNYFDDVGKELPEYKRNQFGATFGTLVTDRLTLFGTYDGLRINKGSTLPSHVPTREMKAGDFSAFSKTILDPFTRKPFSGNRIPLERIHPVAAKMLATIPDPNRSDPFRNFVNNFPLVQNTDTFTGRVDFELNDDSKLFASYSTRGNREVEVNPLPAFGGNVTGRSHDLSIEYTHDFSERMVASLGLQFSREIEQQLSNNVNKRGLLTSLGIAGLFPLDNLDEGYPSFELSGYAGIGEDSDWPTTYFLNTFELNPSFNYVRGRHNIEFASEIGVFQVNNARTGGLRRGAFEFSGDYTGDAFADFLLGIPVVAERGVGSDRADLRRKTWKFIARDDWKISKRFSLSLSLAYNYFPFFRSQRDNISTFAPLRFEPSIHGKMVVTGSAEAAMMGLAGLASGQAVYPDRNDWEPGIGLAFNPLGNNRLVLRASYNLNYDPPDEETAFEFLGRNYPFFYTERAESSEDSPDIDLSRPFQNATRTELNILAIDPQLRNNYIQNWQLTMQNEFLRNWNLELSYKGVKSSRSQRTLIGNVPLPGPGSIQSRRPNPEFGRFSILTGSGSRSAHALRADLKKRVSRGVSLQAGYTWNREFNDEYGEPSNPRNLRLERAPDGGDQYFSLNYIWDLPLGRGQAFPLEWSGKMRTLFEGWRLSGITTINTGGRFNPRLAGDPNNDGVRGDRPNRIGSGELPSRQRSIDQWFSTADFVAWPPTQPYGFGNSGRKVLVAPGSRNWDLSIIKRTKITGSGNLLEFRVQLFNAFNNTNFSVPNSAFGTSSFGKIFGAGRAREIEIALKFSF
jgi:hypothetical protein